MSANFTAIRNQNRATDLETICAINAAAFAEHGGTEAFDRFRAKRDDILSLVAFVADEMVGHVLFSPVSLTASAGTVSGMGLGQLAVKPEWQSKGIGAELCATGIAELRASNCPFIIVIGHAGYYPRFGFETGSLHGVQCQWEGVPDESFMVLFLDQQKQGTLRGVASFDGM
jgi:putative acetyltransferase